MKSAHRRHEKSDTSDDFFVDAYGERRPYREIVTGGFFDKDGKRHEYAYTAVSERGPT